MRRPLPAAATAAALALAVLPGGCGGCDPGGRAFLAFLARRRLEGAVARDLPLPDAA
jgi:hypothetical protein